MTTNTKRLNENWRKWYNNNKAKYNKQRRTRYHKDPEYREKAKANSNLRRVNIKASKTHSIIIDGDKIKMYTITKVSEVLNREGQTIRGWEEKGWIPKPLLPGTKRFYTKNQINLMKKIVRLTTLYKKGGFNGYRYIYDGKLNNLIMLITDEWEG